MSHLSLGLAAERPADAAARLAGRAGTRHEGPQPLERGSGADELYRLVTRASPP